MREIKFKIDANGDGTHEVNGMVGEGCKDLASGLEKYFGKGKSEEKPEFYETEGPERDIQGWS